VRSWDTASPQPGGKVLATGPVPAQSAAFSPDGSTLAAGFADGTIHLVDMARPERTGRTLTAGKRTVYA
ncbi:hypothetical protein G3I24_40860, partial [Micromonospora aurantiaca]|nr:hypothetical protein [Micromonospora aurantiaca]